MATKKAGGTAKNLKDSGPQYLGVKITHGQKARPGNIIVRQRGTVYEAGKNTTLAKDYSIFALKEGTVEFKDKRFVKYNGAKVIKKQVNVK